MNTIVNEIKSTFRHGSVLTRLIYVNLGVFLSVNIIYVILSLFQIPGYVALCGGKIAIDSYWFGVPASFSALLYKPWTIITYMFFHGGFIHILFNMLVLFFSGKIFLEYLGEKRLLSTYFLGGFSGALLYMLFFNVFPVFRDSVNCSIAVGASASVMAILIAIAAYIPNYTVYLPFLGPTRLKYIAIVLVLLDFINIRSNNAGGHIAHLGGALFGYVYISKYKKGSDISAWFNQLVDSIVSYFRSSRSRIKVVHSSKKASRGYRSDEEYNMKRAEKQRKMDEILDKISKSGYESLTKEEKEILFRISNDKA